LIVYLALDEGGGRTLGAIEETLGLTKGMVS